MKTPLHEWFNVYDKNHIEALEHYLEKGEWPRYFIPDDVSTVSTDRQLLLVITNAWIAQSKPANRGLTVPFGGYDG